MVEITHKRSTLRMAIAEATVHTGSPATIQAIKDHQVPKGNVLEIAKAAGYFAVKNTHHSIPDCHPIPVEYTAVEYELSETTIRIIVTVKTVYKTGVEVEAMHGATIIALTLYDMLKPIDTKVEIQRVRLVTKKGGKSDFTSRPERLTASVIVCSDSISTGGKKDKAGFAIQENLSKHHISIDHYQIIPDEIEVIRSQVLERVNRSDLIILTGGTGLSDRDVTPEALEPLIERRIPGIEEAIRSYGQDRTPYSMLSRSVAGTTGHSLILALPGSTRGATESMEAIFPSVLHVFRILQHAKHQHHE